MERLLARQSEWTYAALRFVAGVLLACHGCQKILGWLGGFGGEPGGTAPLLSLMGAAGVIELLGGLLIAIGLMTRSAAFLCSGEMAVAYFLAHAPRGFWPIKNQGELAVVYAFLFLYISARGAGAVSFDALWHRSRSMGLPLSAKPI